MVLMLKSLMPGCFFNIVGFGSTYKSLFPTSQNYDEVQTPPPFTAMFPKIKKNCENLLRCSGSSDPGVRVRQEGQSRHGWDQHPGSSELDPEAANDQGTPAPALPAHRRRH